MAEETDLPYSNVNNLVADGQAILETAPSLDDGLNALAESYTSYRWDKPEVARSSIEKYSEALHYRFKDNSTYSPQELAQVVPVDYPDITGKGDTPEEQKKDKINKWEEANKKVLTESTDVTTLLAKKKMLKSVEATASEMRHQVNINGESNFGDLGYRFLEGATATPARAIEELDHLIGNKTGLYDPKFKASDYVKWLKEHEKEAEGTDLTSYLARVVKPLTGMAGFTAGFVGSTAAGGPLGTVGYLGATGVGAVLDERDRALEESGDSSKANKAAAIQTLNQIIQLTVAGKLFGKLGAAGVTEELASSVTSTLGKNVTGHAVTLGASGGVNQLLSNIAGNIGKGEEVTLENTLEGAGESAALAATFGVITGGVQTAKEVVNRPGVEKGNFGGFDANFEGIINPNQSTRALVRPKVSLGELQGTVLARNLLGDPSLDQSLDILSNKRVTGEVRAAPIDEMLTNDVQAKAEIKPDLTTEDGSSYISTEDGATKRVSPNGQVYHPLDKTFYVDEETAVSMAARGLLTEGKEASEGGKWYAMTDGTNLIGAITNEKGEIVARTKPIKASTEPGEGLYPVEVNAPRSPNENVTLFRSRIGTKIKGVTPKEPVPPEDLNALKDVNIPLVGVQDQSIGAAYAGGMKETVTGERLRTSTTLSEEVKNLFKSVPYITIEASDESQRARVKNQGLVKSTDTYFNDKDFSDSYKVNLGKVLLEKYDLAIRENKGNKDLVEQLEKTAQAIGIDLADKLSKSAQTLRIGREMAEMLDPFAKVKQQQRKLTDKAIEDVAKEEKVPTEDIRNIDQKIDDLTNKLNQEQKIIGEENLSAANSDKTPNEQIGSTLAGEGIHPGPLTPYEKVQRKVDQNKDFIKEKRFSIERAVREGNKKNKTAEEIQEKVDAINEHITSLEKQNKILEALLEKYKGKNTFPEEENFGGAFDSKDIPYYKKTEKIRTTGENQIKESRNPKTDQLNKELQKAKKTKEKLDAKVAEKQALFTEKDQITLKNLYDLLRTTKDETIKRKVWNAIDAIKDKLEQEPLEKTRKAYIKNVVNKVLAKDALFNYFVSNILTPLSVAKELQSDVKYLLHTPIALLMSGKPQEAQAFVKGAVKALFDYNSETGKVNSQAFTAIVNTLLTGENTHFRGKDFVATAPTILKPIGFIGRTLSAFAEGFSKSYQEGYINALTYEYYAKQGKQEGIKTPKDLKVYIAEKLFDSTNSFEKALTEAKITSDKLQELTGKGLSEREQKLAAWDLLRNKAPDYAKTEAEYLSKKSVFVGHPTGFLGYVYDALSTLKDVPVGFNKEGQGALTIRPFSQPLAFLRVGLNIINAKLDYAGAGIIRSFFAHENLGFSKVTEGGKRQANYRLKSDTQRAVEFGRGAIGLFMGYTIFQAAMANKDEATPGFMIHGKGSNNWQAVTQDIEKGKLPYSIQIGTKYQSFKDTTLEYPLTIIGNMMDKIRDKNADDSTTNEMIFSGAVGIIDALANESMFKSISDLWSGVKSIGSDNAYAGSKIVDALIGVPKSLIPGRGIASAFSTDPIDSKTSTWSRFISGLPIIQQLGGTKPALNYLGEPVKVEPNISRAVNIFGFRSNNQTNVAPELRWVADNGYDLPKDRFLTITLLNKDQIEKHPRTVEERTARLGAAYKGVLTQEERYDLIKTAGTKIKSVINSYMNRYGSSGYQKDVQEQLNKDIGRVFGDTKKEMFLKD